MALHCLLLTRDATLLAVIRAGFSAVNVELEMRTDVTNALPRMQREHRRYFRYKVNLPIELLCQTGATFAGKMMNVSEGGLAVTRFGPASVEGVVTVRFTLPSLKAQIIQAKAD